MTKTDLINAMVEKSTEKLTKVHCKEMVDLMHKCIMEALAKEEEVSLAGFGTFKLSAREARTGINPKTREAINIPASKSVTFRSAKALKDSVNS